MASFSDRIFQGYETLCVKIMGFSPMTPGMKEGESLKSYNSRALSTFAKIIVWLVCFNFLAFFILFILLRITVALVGKVLEPSSTVTFAMSAPLVIASLYIGASLTKKVIVKIWPAKQPNSVH